MPAPSLLTAARSTCPGDRGVIADEIWRRFGQLTHYQERTFASGLEILFSRPHPITGDEQINDSGGLILNFLRSARVDRRTLALLANDTGLSRLDVDLSQRLDDEGFHDLPVAAAWVRDLFHRLGRGWGFGPGADQIINGGLRLEPTDERDQINQSDIHMVWCRLFRVQLAVTLPKRSWIEQTRRKMTGIVLDGRDGRTSRDWALHLGKSHEHRIAFRPTADDKKAPSRWTEFCSGDERIWFSPHCASVPELRPSPLPAVYGQQPSGRAVIAVSGASPSYDDPGASRTVEDAVRELEEVIRQDDMDTPSGNILLAQEFEGRPTSIGSEFQLVTNRRGIMIARREKSTRAPIFKGTWKPCGPVTPSIWRAYGRVRTCRDDRADAVAWLWKPRALFLTSESIFDHGRCAAREQVPVRTRHQIEILLRDHFVWPLRGVRWDSAIQIVRRRKKDLQVFRFRAGDTEILIMEQDDEPLLDRPRSGILGLRMRVTLTWQGLQYGLSAIFLL